MREASWEYLYEVLTPETVDDFVLRYADFGWFFNCADNDELRGTVRVMLKRLKVVESEARVEGPWSAPA